MPPLCQTEMLLFCTTKTSKNVPKNVPFQSVVRAFFQLKASGKTLFYHLPAKMFNISSPMARKVGACISRNTELRGLI